jgi:RNA polymerase sigma-70 factor (ECF subfamily)
LEAFSQAVVALIPRLRRYARALVREPSRADDLVQDTLERAWAKRGLWRPGSDLGAWLFTVMHHLHVNQVRRTDLAADAQALNEEALAAPVPARAEGPILLRDLERALDQLSAEQREVLALVAVEEMRYQEVAEVLGIPIGTVMSRLSRARERLRWLLQGQDQPRLRRVK